MAATTPSHPISDAISPTDLCDEVPVLLWQAEANGLLSYFNHQVHEYSGATHEELAGAGWLRVVHPDDRQRVMQRWAHSLATRAPCDIELRIRHRDQSYRWFLVQARPAVLHEVDRVGWIGVCTDVQRYAASISSPSSASLASRPILHDSDGAPWLHQRELERVARRATARETSRAISHLLNQPLTAILSNSQALQGMLKRAAEGSELGQTVADIVEEVRRAIQMLREWKTMLQGTTPQLTRVRINELVRGATSLLVGDLIANRCELELQLSARSPTVRADVAQMQYAMAMLIMNACEVMADLPVEARRIRVRTMQASAEYACIEVADRGPGVRSGVLRAFEPPPALRLPGLGLGMGICKGIVEAHGGRLQFVTPAFEGAVFRVELPVARDVRGRTGKAAGARRRS